MYSKPIILSDFSAAIVLASMEFADTGNKFPREFEWVKEYHKDAKNVLYNRDDGTTSYYIRVMQHDDFLRTMQKHIEADIIFHYKYLKDNFPHKNYAKQYIEDKYYNTYWVDELNINVENLIKSIDK